MAVPLSSKQIAPDQYRHTPPAPLFGSDLISRSLNVWSNGTKAGTDEALFGSTFMVYSAKRNPHEFMFRFRGWPQATGPTKRMGIVPRPEST